MFGCAGPAVRNTAALLWHGYVCCLVGQRGSDAQHAFRTTESHCMGVGEARVFYDCLGGPDKPGSMTLLQPCTGSSRSSFYTFRRGQQGFLCHHLAGCSGCQPPVPNFLYIDAGKPGCVGDAQFDVMCRHRPYMLGDAAFKQEEYLIKQIPGQHAVGSAEHAFNAAHCASRRVVENAFGHLKGAFRILNKAWTRDAQFLQEVVAVCCALHNFRKLGNILWGIPALVLLHACRGAPWKK